METKLEGECTRFLSVWKVQCKRDFMMSALLEANLPEGNLHMGLAKKYHEFLASELKDKERLQHLQLLYNFMAFVFCKEEAPYYITSWVGDYLIHENLIDIVMYPSTATALNSVNYALRPAFVDQNLRLEKVYKIQTGLTDKDHVGISLLEVGDSDGTNVIWRERNDEDEVFFGTP